MGSFKFDDQYSHDQLKNNIFDTSFQKFKYYRLSNGKIYEDLSILLKDVPKFNCDLNFYFLFI